MSKTDAIARLQKYVIERKKLSGIDVNDIHGLHSGTDREAFLLLSDIEAVLPKTWWISFVSDDEQLHGVIIVDAEDNQSAIQRCHDLGINPGGQAMVVEAPATEEVMAEMQHYGRNRLIPPEELTDYKKLGDLTQEQQNLVDHHATVACNECNHDRS